MKNILLAILFLSISATAEEAKHSCCPSPPAAADIHTDSLFQIRAPFTNTQGKEVTLSSLKGRPHLVAMFYASCPTICPRLIADIQALQDKLGPDLAARLPVVLVSFDPVRDTPEALRHFAEKRQLDAERWQLWTGTDADVRTLAAALGVRYRKTDDGEISHSTAVHLLDAEGRIAARLEGIGAENALFVEQVKIQMQKVAP